MMTRSDCIAQVLARTPQAYRVAVRERLEGLLELSPRVVDADGPASRARLAHFQRAEMSHVLWEWSL